MQVKHYLPKTYWIALTKHRKGMKWSCSLVWYFSEFIYLGNFYESQNASLTKATQSTLWPPLIFRPKHFSPLICVAFLVVSLNHAQYEYARKNLRFLLSSDDIIRFNSLSHGRIFFADFNRSSQRFFNNKNANNIYYKIMRHVTIECFREIGNI